MERGQLWGGQDAGVEGSESQEQPVRELRTESATVKPGVEIYRKTDRQTNQWVHGHTNKQRQKDTARKTDKTDRFDALQRDMQTDSRCTERLID